MFSINIKRNKPHYKLFVAILLTIALTATLSTSNVFAQQGVDSKLIYVSNHTVNPATPVRPATPDYYIGNSPAGIMIPYRAVQQNINPGQGQQQNQSFQNTNTRSQGGESKSTKGKLRSLLGF